MKLTASALIVAISLLPFAPIVAATPVVLQVRPSVADSRISRFDEPNMVVYSADVADSAPLAVFLPGTGGAPGRATALLEVVAGQGYRVVGLEYNDEPAVIQACAQDRARQCAERFRARRVFGGSGSQDIDDRPWESISSRLVALLVYLKDHDNKIWGSYLSGNEPDWPRIVVSGLSQGAGMAAFLAKKRMLKRVVLFSGPWDHVGASRELAPWLSEPGATPSSLWFAEYHRLENTADQISSAYRALKIPEDHVLVFDLSLPLERLGPARNPYHASTAHLLGYTPQWRVLFGCAGSCEAQN